MDQLMHDIGYRINYDVLRQEIKRATGKKMTTGVKRWFEAATPFIVAAYQKGEKHQPLSDIFPFLEKEEATA